ncbi:MAG: DUF3592 domain-containing protein [Chitinophagaceae bacterium]
MKFSSGSVIIGTILLVGGSFILLFLVFFNRRRKKIVNMNHQSTGIVSDIIQRIGIKGNIYYQFIIRYDTLAGSPVTINHYSIKKPKESEVILYYDPAKPEKFVLKNDGQFRSVNIIFGIFAVLFLAGAVCAFLFL